MINSEMEGELVHELGAHEAGFGESHEAAAEWRGGREHGHGSQAEMASQVFYNHLTAMADRGGRSQALRRIALAAARRALRSYRPASGIEGEGEGEFFGEGEGEGESSLHEFSLEGELNPVRRADGDAMLEHLGHSAAEAESELEAAEQFLPAVPIAARLVMPVLARRSPALARTATRVIARTVPVLTRAVGQVAGTLYRSPVARPLVRALPGIVKGTVVDIARRVAHGRPVTLRGAVQSLARQTVRQLSNPRRLVRSYRHSNARDRRYHYVVSRLTGIPVHRGRAPVATVVQTPGYRAVVNPAPVYTNGYAAAPVTYAPVPTQVAGTGTVCRCQCGQH